MSDYGTALSRATKAAFKRLLFNIATKWKEYTVLYTFAENVQELNFSLLLGL